MTWSSLYARFRQPVIDAVSVAVATFVGAWATSGVKPSDALLLALAAGGAVLLKAINPVDPSYGVGAKWRDRPLPTTLNK